MATLCFLLVLVLTSVAADSILDMIDTKAVERIVAERRANSSKEFLLDNNSLLEEETTESILRNSTEDHQLQDILRRRGSSLLRSSKDALLVTRKEYLRRDWCKSEPLVQVVQEEGCSPVTVLNRFCYGQCNSFYIPKGPRR
ncbi:gremlin-1-like isoform X2 [Macrosteles quadrilineatus]|nr:gremlin-1-like isoform X2 [Macrosteles quadrilineatus]